jgi:Ser/Thr protein kinase RdoA (MazF antagonist)
VSTAPAPPPDTLLPLADALDGGAVAAALARHLPVGVERCAPCYVKYRPGRSCLVMYELELEDARTGGRVATLGHAAVLGGKRADRLWSRIADSGLPERAARLHPELPRAAACRLPELGAVMQLFPVDVRLPGLTAATTPAFMGSTPELVRYKPGRRAVLRYELETRVLYGKLRADGAGAAQIALADALIERGVPTPVPKAYLHGVRMIVHCEVRGTRLAELRGYRAFADWMEPIAEVLARLHGTSIAGLPAHLPEAEAADLEAAAETAAALLPHRRADIEGLATRLGSRLAAIRPRAATIHGSFHDDQVVVGDGGVMLVDLDSAALGDPLLDVGHFASYLSAADQLPARDRFLAAYASRRPAGNDALLHEAVALLRWSSLPFRELAPDWPAAMERRLELALERLAEYERRADPA